MRIAAYAALPTLGLVAGPSYSGLVFGAGILCFLHSVGSGHELPRPDWRLTAVAALFILLCMAGLSWSIVPGVTMRGCVQMAAILTGALLFIAVPPRRGALFNQTDALFTTLLGATAAGALLMVADWASGFHLQGLISARPDMMSVTKYNRGIDYLVFIGWPGLAYFCCRRLWGRAAILIVLIGVVTALGASLAGKVAALGGLAVLSLALWAPNLAASLLEGGLVLFAASWPFVLHGLAAERLRLAPFLKSSAVQRLEIWDYMTTAVLKHPVRGWGLLASKSVPIPPGPLWRFLYHHGEFIFVPGPGTYPHDQWLQLWVETGALGVILAGVFAFLAIRSARSLASSVRPFAFASIAAILVVSCVNFDLTTDSWWAAVAATGFLFMVLERDSPAERSRAFR